jgi:endogenous inhibitor of DNA gyrase (YacG/DUF329 family)
MASVSREKKRMTILCPVCRHKVVKNVINKGAGG